jgi:rubredoxin
MADQGLPPAGRFVGNPLVNLYQNRIKQLISDLGRDVTFTLTPHEINCPNCGWDYTQGRSNNIYTANASGATYNKTFPTGGRCPVCQGKGKLQFTRTVVYKCLIGFGPAPEEFDYQAYGLVPDQVIRLKNALAIFDDINNAQFITIDGFECEKITIPRKSGLRDLAFITSYWKRRNT